MKTLEGSAKWMAEGVDAVIRCSMGDTIDVLGPNEWADIERAALRAIVANGNTDEVGVKLEAMKAAVEWYLSTERSTQNP